MSPEVRPAPQQLGSHEHPVMLRTPFSHYCRKVDWAMAHAGLQYRTLDVSIPAMRYIQRANPTERTVPVLVVGTEVLSGSDRILHWIDDHRAPDTPPLYPADTRNDIEAWERWTDEAIGPTTRREGYRALIAKPGLFGRTFKQRLQLRAGRPMFKQVMRYYKAERYPDDNAQMHRVFDRISERLDTQGTGYFFAAHPTAADFATAALLSPVMPAAKHLGYTRHPRWKDIVDHMDRVKPHASTRVGKRKIEEADWRAFETLNAPAVQV